MTDPEFRWKVHQAKAATLKEALHPAVEVEAFFSAEKRGSGTKILQAVTTQSPTPADTTLKQELHKLETLGQGLVQQPRCTFNLSQVIGKGPGIHQSVGLVPKGTFNATALNV